MRRCVLSIAAFTFAVLALAAPLATPASDAPSIASSAVQGAIVAAIERDRARYGGRTPIPAAIIGIWDDKGPKFVRAFGYENLATKTPLSMADHFRIGSNTKTFVAAVLLQLVAEGKLSLDDPLSHFQLGVTVPNARNVTVRDLCTMRSGLYEAYDTPQFAAMKGLPQNFDPRTLVKWAVQQKPYFAPNAGYHYSNTNYLLLGLIVESITKDSIAGEIEKRFIEPYGLTQTSFPQTDAMPEPWAHGYALDRAQEWHDVSNTVPVAITGSAGAMISSADDIRRWIRIYANGRATGKATYKDLIGCIPFLGNTSFGLGITCSAGWYGYTGALPGYNTADYYSPATGLTVVAWIDYQASAPIEGVASVMVRDVARILTPNHVPFVYTQAQLHAMQGH